MRSLLFLTLLIGCGSSAPAPADGGVANDLAQPSSGCQAATDCRLYSSYCSTAPCECLPLARAQADPPCTGQQMSCIVDPCTNKRADCIGGSCVVSP